MLFHVILPGIPSFIPAVFYQPINSRLQLFARDFSFLHGISHFCTEISSRFEKSCTLINQSVYSIFEQYVIKRNNYRHVDCGASLTGKTSSVCLIFTHRNVKNR